MNQFWETCVYIDEVLKNHEIPYCIIKSYNGVEDYNDGNVDVLVDHNLLDLHRIAFSDDFKVTLYNRAKYTLYERNKLMLMSKVELSSLILMVMLLLMMVSTHS